MKSIQYFLGYTFIYFIICSSCEYAEDSVISELDLLFNSWQIDQVFIDGQEDIVTDYSLFNLEINSDNTFDLSDINGNNLSGTWELQNNDTQLVLNPGSQGEIMYIIVEIQEDKLVLITEIENFKDIPASFKFILIPDE